MNKEVWEKKDSGVLVEAVRVNEDNVREVATWSGGTIVEEKDLQDGDDVLGINLFTPDGMARVSYHMYVIKYGKAFFAVHPRVFEERYKPRDRPQDAPESIGDTRRRLGFSDPFGGPHHQ